MRPACFKLPQRSWPPRAARLRVVVAAACALAMSWQAVSAAEPVTPIGRYGDQVLRGEHCSGRVLDLWASGRQVLGLLSVCDGLVDTRAVVRLEEAALDPATRKLSFTARFSLGTLYLGGGREERSREVWRFTGTLTPGALQGVAVAAEEAFAPPRIRRQVLRLRKLKTGPDPYPDGSAWQAATEARLSGTPAP